MENQQQNELAYLYQQNVQLQQTVNDLTNLVRQMQEQINNIQLMTIADSSFLPDNQKQNALIELYNKQEQENSRKEAKSRWSQSL